MASDPDGGDHRRDRKYDLVSATRRAPLTLAGNEPTSILSSIDPAFQSGQTSVVVPGKWGTYQALSTWKYTNLPLITTTTAAAGQRTTCFLKSWPVEWISASTGSSYIHRASSASSTSLVIADLPSRLCRLPFQSQSSASLESAAAKSPCTAYPRHDSRPKSLRDAHLHLSWG